MILVGPVIGNVSINSARILIETDIKSEITIILTDIITNKSFKLTKQLLARFPSVFEFLNLEPSTKYSVTFENEIKFINEDISKLSSHFRTLSTNLSFTKICFLSCNAYRHELEMKPENSLWKNLSDRIEEIDFIIHFGDQGYLDNDRWIGNKTNVYDICCKMVESVKYTEYINFQSDIREMKQDEYRNCWTLPATANVLRNSPNFMILDDHEIFDNLGFLPSEKDQTSSDYFFMQQARFCYYQYQRQLWVDVDFKDFSSVKEEHQIHILNKIGIFMMDYRTSKNWCREIGDNSNLGNRQWNDIYECFKPDGKFKNVEAALFIAPSPLIFFGKEMSRAGKKFDIECQELWTYKYTDELVKLLDILRNWREETKKEIVLLGGDVHLGGKQIYFLKENLH